MSDPDLPIYQEWAYDFEKNEFLKKGGKYYKVQKNDALKIWIYKALKTQRYRYPAYSRQFGSEWEDLIGLSENRGIIESEIERYIQEALLVNPYITDVSDFDFQYSVIKNDKITNLVTFTVSTIYGDLTESEEIYGEYYS
jgi:hypothetical protein